MNTINSSKMGDLGNDPTSEEGTEKSIPPHPHERNITEGGEFLDDALRTEDLIDETNKKPWQKVSCKHLF
jgi:hypothetical protein